MSNKLPILSEEYKEEFCEYIMSNAQVDIEIALCEYNAMVESDPEWIGDPSDDAYDALCEWACCCDTDLMCVG